MAVLYAGCLVGLLGAVALGTDVAMLYWNWSLVQKAVDSSALAGVHYLPGGPTTAGTVATTYAHNNGISDTELTSVSCIDTTRGTWLCSDTTHQPANFTPTQVQVSAQRSVPYFFAKALGLTTGVVKVSGTAQLMSSPSTIGPNCVVNCTGAVGTPNGPPATSGSVSGTCGNSTGQYDVLPIAVDNQTASAWVAGQTYTLNRQDVNGNGAWPDAPGNWGNVALCGNNNNGGSSLRTAIANGFYGPISIGQTLTSLPGAKVGPVNQGFQDLIGASSDQPSAGIVGDPRMVIVPLVDYSNCHGTCALPITGFMAFYIDSYNNGAINGHFEYMFTQNTIGNPNVTSDRGINGDAILIR